MTRVQTEITKFEIAIRQVIENHRGPYLPYSAIIGVLSMVSFDLNREAEDRYPSIKED